MAPVDEGEAGDKDRKCEFEGRIYEHNQFFSNNNTHITPTRSNQCVNCICQVHHLNSLYENLWIMLFMKINSRVTCTFRYLFFPFNILKNIFYLIIYYKVRDIFFFHYYAARKIFTVRCPWELCLIRTFIFSPDKSTAIWRRVTSLPDAASFTSLQTPVVQFVSVCIFETI